MTAHPHSVRVCTMTLSLPGWVPSWETVPYKENQRHLWVCWTRNEDGAQSFLWGNIAWKTDTPFEELKPHLGRVLEDGWRQLRAAREVALIADRTLPSKGNLAGPKPPKAPTPAAFIEKMGL